MNEPFHEPLTFWRFIRRYFVRIVIGAVLVAMVYGALLVWVSYQREQRIAKEIEAYGGIVEFRYAGPDWILQSMRDRTILFNRVWSASIQIHPSDELIHPSEKFLSELAVLTNLTQLFLNTEQVTDAGLEHLKGLTKLRFLTLDNTQVTDAGLDHLKGLASLEWLILQDTQITDAGLEHLKGLTSLTELDLDDTHVTDAGLEHLKGLTNLVRLELDGTQVTAKGRAMLRKTLPGCIITPEPYFTMPIHSIERRGDSVGR